MKCALQNQVDDLIGENRATIDAGERVLVTTLTKRMAEELSRYLDRLRISCSYIHSEVKTLDRIEIIRNLREGVIDVLVGVNLLREGLDLPEVSLVAVMDADKEGFLRSNRSLTQTAGRAARNVNGRVLMYADKITDSIAQTIEETARAGRNRKPTTPSTARPRAGEADQNRVRAERTHRGPPIAHGGRAHPLAMASWRTPFAGTSRPAARPWTSSWPGPNGKWSGPPGWLSWMPPACRTSSSPCRTQSRTGLPEIALRPTLQPTGRTASFPCLQPEIDDPPTPLHRGLMALLLFPLSLLAQVPHGSEPLWTSPGTNMGNPA